MLANNWCKDAPVNCSESVKITRQRSTAENANALCVKPYRIEPCILAALLEASEFYFVPIYEGFAISWSGPARGECDGETRWTRSRVDNQVAVYSREPFTPETVSPALWLILNDSRDRQAVEVRYPYFLVEMVMCLAMCIERTGQG
jgi:hypothetical protein